MNAEERDLAAISAKTFFDETLQATETFTDVVDCMGQLTMIDIYYLMGAILKGGYIEVFPGGSSRIVEFVEQLPSSTEWLKYIQIVGEPA